MSAVDARQLALDLPIVEGLDPTDYLVASSNRAAYEGVMRWPAWPSTAFLILGPEGSGKTHLAGIWAARARALGLTPASLWEPAGPLARLGPRRAALVDDADLVADETAFFHLYNILQDRAGHLLLTARRPVADWPLRLPDLRSRLLTAWSVRIDPPDDPLLAALLVKHFADRQIRVEPDVIAYLLPRMERSFASVRRIATALDRASLCERRPIRVALVRSVLEAEARTREAELAAGMVDTEWRTASWISA